MKVIHIGVILALLIYSFALFAEDESADISEPDLPTEPSNKMNNAKLGELILQLDENAQGRPGFWQINIDEFEIFVVTDERAGRMRAMVPILPSAEVAPEEMERLMQANFDSALDARYSIANDTLWAAFIHPLSDLSEELFISGVAQSVNLAATYGTTYSSGAVIFNGGDSREHQRNYYQEIIDRANAI